MTPQAQELFQKFQELPYSEQAEFMYYAESQPTPEEEAELDRRELEPKIDIQTAMAQIRQNLAVRRKSAA